MSERIRMVRSHGERGSIVAFVILAPVLIMMILGVVQVAIVGHVRHVATLAATAGVSEAAAFDGSETAGLERARAQLDQSSGWVIDPSVSATREDPTTASATATVVVDAKAFQILPFGNWDVRVRRTQPVERPQD